MPQERKHWLTSKLKANGLYEVFRPIDDKQFEIIAGGLPERAAKQIAAALNACNFIVNTIADQERRPTYLADRRKWEAKRLELIRLAAVTGADE